MTTVPTLETTTAMPTPPSPQAPADAAQASVAVDASTGETAPSAAGGPPSLDEMLQRLRQLPALYAIHMEPTRLFRGATKEGRDMLRRHYAYMLELEARGVLLLGGAVDVEGGPGAAMVVVRATSRAEAEQIAAAEPYAQAGWRKNKVRSWTLRFGAGVDAIEKHAVSATA